MLVSEELEQWQFVDIKRGDTIDRLRFKNKPASVFLDTQAGHGCYVYIVQHFSDLVNLHILVKGQRKYTIFPEENRWYVPLSKPAEWPETVYISKLQNLRHLWLPAPIRINCFIGPLGAKELSRLANLQSLNLNNHIIKNQGANYLSVLKNLQKLSLNSNYIDDQGASSISRLSNLTCLQFLNNRVGPRGAAFLSKLPALQKLYLTDNKVKDQGAAFISQLTHLTFLSLAKNRLSMKGIEYISTLEKLDSLLIDNTNLLYCGFLFKFPHLTVLSVCGCNIGDHQALIISKLLGLKSLHIGYNNLSFKGANRICSLTNIQKLQFTKNIIGSKGLSYIFNLKQLKSLAVCNAGCQIGPQGAQKIAQLTAIENLFLGTNQIGDEGLMHVCKLTNLRILSTDDNGITDSGAYGLEKLVFLEEADLRLNQLSDKCRLHLTGVLSKTSFEF